MQDDVTTPEVAAIAAELEKESSENTTESSEPKETSDWVKTPTTNLYRWVPNGKYYCKAKVNGRNLTKSLNTRSYEIARIKLEKLLAQRRQKVKARLDEDLKFADLAAEYLQRMEEKVDMKPRAKEYRRETLENGIRGTWAGIDNLMPKHFTERAVLDWAAKIRAKYAPSRYNGIVQTLRGILQVAVDKGLLHDNPAQSRGRNSVRGVPSAPVPVHAPAVPDVEEFNKLLKHLDASPKRAAAARMVRFLAFTGCRIGAARLVMPEHVDLERNEIAIPAIKYDTEPNRIPIIPELRPVLEELLRDYPGAGPLLPIKNPKNALNRACEDAGIAHINNHTLRHAAGSRFIQCGVDIPSVARFLGHRDKGKTLLKVYAHSQNSHLQSMAKKISFGTQTTEAPKPMDYSI